VSVQTPALSLIARLNLAEFPADAAWSADGSALIVAGGDATLLRISVGLMRGSAGDAAIERIGTHRGGVLRVAWQPGGALFASSGQDGEVRLWDSRTVESRTVHAAAEWSEQLCFSGNGKMLAIATGRRLQLLDSQGREIALLPEHAGVIAALAWRPKLSEIAAACNGGIRVHRCTLPNAGDAEVQSRDYEWKGACLTASWRPDGSVLASGMQDGSVHFWNVAAGTQSQMRGYGAKVSHTGWSANGRYLATSADANMVVWEFAGRGPEGSEPLQLQAHTERVTQLQFQPRGPLLATGARDRRVLLWRPGASEEALDGDLLGEEIVLLRFAPDGRSLAVGDRNGELSLYDIR
jgi:WD40 repeat protein